MAPKFITIEGIEGVGKSTSLRYIQEYLERKSVDFIVTREPGGTPIAEAIRQVLLVEREEILISQTELLLMFAARAQHIAHVIKPALDAGKWVVCDRFTDASYAYQGAGRGVSVQEIAMLEQWVQNDLRPDLTLLLDAPVDIALQRAKHRSTPDRIEKEKAEFFERVRAGYLARVKMYPAQYHVINATHTLEAVQQEIQKTLENFL